MPVTATPIYVQTPKATTVQVGTANTNRDGSTGTYSSEITVGANGGILESIKVHGTGTTTAGVVRAFYASDGTNFRLLAEIMVTAITPSTSLAAYGSTTPSEGLWVPPGGVPFNLTASSKLKFSTHNAETFNVHVSHGDY